ncbi:MAG: septum formation inhibitor Maf [Magnetococcales bacterium]|nr:septum formation inhibitor Maf [Magnetococcales bacterium]
MPDTHEESLPHQGKDYPRNQANNEGKIVTIFNSGLPWGNPKLKICLASASPRRLELLGQVGLHPEVLPVDIDESRHPGEGVKPFVERLARSKAEAAVVGDGVDLVIGADTVVVVGEHILGKPENEQEAREMLKQLSDRPHEVVTGVAVLRPVDQLCRSRAVVTKVWFKPLSQKEINAYVASGEPLDKAGAYGIQGLGGFMVSHLEGSYTGVVGLPLFETLEMIAGFQNREAGGERG